MSRTALDERYVRLRRLGGGGMGEVHLARDELLSREVALKVPRGPRAGSVEFAERFRREARHVAALSHPNIVRVFDAGETSDGTPYMAMEYVSGGTLRDRLLEKGALPARAAASVALQISDALCAAHARGVIHRDVKPENVLISESGDAKVADFGIARAADATAMTRTSQVLGTVRYLSPEQAMGESVGPASDLYSLGVVLYEMLTGKVPFEAEGPLAVAIRHLTQEPPPLRELEPSVPAALVAITLRLLEKRPEGRYGSAEELAEDLERFLAGDVAFSTARTARVPTPVSDEKRSSRRVRRRRSRVLVAVLLAVSLAVVVVSIGATAGIADPVSRHPLVEQIIALDDGREPLDRAFAPSTPVTGGELEIPERDANAQSEAAPSKERVEEGAETPPSGPQPTSAVVPAQRRPAALEQPVSPPQRTEQPPVSETVAPAPAYRVEHGGAVTVAGSSGPPDAPQQVAVRESEPTLAARVIAGLDMNPAEPPEVEALELEMPEAEVEAVALDVKKRR